MCEQGANAKTGRWLNVSHNDDCDSIIWRLATFCVPSKGTERRWIDLKKFKKKTTKSFESFFYVPSDLWWDSHESPLRWSSIRSPLKRFESRLIVLAQELWFFQRNFREKLIAKHRHKRSFKQRQRWNMLVERTNNNACDKPKTIAASEWSNVSDLIF